MYVLLLPSLPIVFSQAPLISRGVVMGGGGGGGGGVIEITQFINYFCVHLDLTSIINYT